MISIKSYLYYIHINICAFFSWQVDVRVSPFFFNRTCGMCGDCNVEQYMDLKTPRGRPYTSQNKLKYGHMWMVPEDTCSQGILQSLAI